MPERIAVLPHKATPLTLDVADDESPVCALCGFEIRLVPGGNGPTWVHNHSGAVAGFPDASTRRVIKGFMDSLGPSPWGSEALTALADWLARLGFTVEESTQSVDEYIQGLAMANSRNNEWRCTDRNGARLVVGMHVTVLGPRKHEPHKGEGSITRLLPGAPSEVPNVTVTDDEGLDITVNCVNTEIDPRHKPHWAADWGKP